MSNLIVNPRAFPVTRTIIPRDTSGIFLSALAPDGQYLALGFYSGLIEVIPDISELGTVTELKLGV